jgi:hypothetical protein
VAMAADRLSRHFDRHAASHLALVSAF